MPVTKELNFIDFAKVFSLNIVLFIVFAGLVSILPGSEEFLTGLHPSMSFAILYLIQFVVMFLPLWIFVIDKKGFSLSDFDFKKFKIGRLIGYVLLAYVIYFFFMMALGTIMSYLDLSVPGFEQQESYVPIFGTDIIGWVVGFVFISIMAPLFEEIFFRGFIYRVFTKTWPVWLGSILTAILFSLLHFQWGTFMPLLFLGLVMNVLYEKTRNLWFPIAFHMMNNTISYGFQLYFELNPDVLETLETLEAEAAFLYNMMTLV